MTFDTPPSAPGTARTNMLIGLVPPYLGMAEIFGD